MSEVTGPRLVKALYNFKGTNNDELCFGKGDLLTVTQVVEGGWWEGTIHNKTGWFPSNYVRETKNSEGRAGSRSPTEKPADLSMNKRQSMLHYRNVVLLSLTDSERTFQEELRSKLLNYLQPLPAANILTLEELNKLRGNLEDVVKLHQSLLSALDECSKLPIPQQKVGGILMNNAPLFKAQYMTYSANHPDAVDVLHHHKDELGRYMEGRGAPSPGIMSLTTSLSLPFTRLDKYANILKELERHTDESHADRGDTQRAISVYTDITLGCTECRKQKQIEFDILHSNIRGWEGEEISTLGDVLSLAHIRVHSENGEKKEQLFLLFPGVLLLLSVSPRNSGFNYEGKLTLGGVAVNGLEDTETVNHAFDIAGSMIDRRVISCSSANEKRIWMELLREQAKHGPRQLPEQPRSLAVSTSQPSITTVTQARAALVVQPPTPPRTVTTAAWGMWCLRPAPPLRPAQFSRDEAQRSPRSGRRILGGTARKKPERAYSEDEQTTRRRSQSHIVGEDGRGLEDDAVLLKVIEAYCTSTKTRQTVNSSLLENPQVIIAEEEKIIVEEMKGDQTVMEEKTLVDTVYSLKDQLKEVKQEQQRLRKDLEDEKRSRKRLESLMRKSLRSYAGDTTISSNISLDDPSVSLT